MSRVLALGRRRSASISSTRSLARRAMDNARLTATTDLPSSPSELVISSFCKRRLRLHVRQPRAEHPEHLGPRAVGFGDGNQALFWTWDGDAGPGRRERSATYHRSVAAGARPVAVKAGISGKAEAVSSATPAGVEVSTTAAGDSTGAGSD